MLRCLARHCFRGKKPTRPHPSQRTAPFGISGHVQDQVYLLLSQKVCWLECEGVYWRFAVINEAMTASKSSIRSSR